MSLDIDHLRSWIDRTETLSDVATKVPPTALAATLDREGLPFDEGAELPPCWHWLYFLPLHAQSELGPDGHPQRGGFLPPVPLPRRMWAGSQLTFHAPLRVGQAIERTSRIVDVRLKEGRTGSLVFVNVQHEIQADGVAAISERQDIVYRDMPAAPATPVAASAAHAAQPAAPQEADWSRRIEPDQVLLFRYSALTFNGHRIHYDRRYTTSTEGYPGLVVHGPLTATLLLDLLHRHLPGARVRDYTFRGVSPLFDVAPFTVSGRVTGEGEVALWAANAAGGLAMEATATLA